MNNICDNCGDIVDSISGECPCCGLVKVTYFTTEVIEAIKDGHNLRKQNRFDAAFKRYDDAEIIIRNSKDSNTLCDILYYKLLCTYGVEYRHYVDSPDIDIVCHYAYLESIKDSKLFEEFNELDSKNKYAYNKELDKIENERMLICNAPNDGYQVFICTKISDKQNRKYNPETRSKEPKAEEFYYASDLYEYLNNKKYNVFFSEKTMEKYTGNYFGYLFKAMQNSEIIIVVYSSYENLVSRNVALEWEYFKKEGKKIIPVYIEDNEAKGMQILQRLGLQANQAIFSSDSKRIIDLISSKLEHQRMDRKDFPTIKEMERSHKKVEKLDLFSYLLFIFVSSLFVLFLELFRSDFIFNIEILDDLYFRYIGLGSTGLVSLILLVIILFKKGRKKQKLITENNKCKKACLQRIKIYQSKIKDKQTGNITQKCLKYLEELKQIICKIQLEDIDIWERIYLKIYSINNSINNDSIIEIRNKLENLVYDVKDEL